MRFFSKRSRSRERTLRFWCWPYLRSWSWSTLSGFRHHKRFDLTTEKLYTLSDQTRNIVRGLKQDVTIDPVRQDGESTFDDLMAEYKNLTPHFKFQNVDPQQKPEVAQEYGAPHMGDVIVSFGNAQGARATGRARRLAEQDITGAILKVTSDKVKKVCFVTGHGEKASGRQSAGRLQPGGCGPEEGKLHHEDASI